VKEAILAGVIGISAVPASQVSLGFRRGWVRYLNVALSSAGGAALVFGVFELLRQQPAEGFGILSAWGPWPVVVLAGLAIAARGLSRLSDTLQTTLGSVVKSIEQGADAQQKMAEAQTRTADAMSRLGEQGWQHTEEIRRLAMYAAQEFPSVYERFDRQDAALGKLAEAITKLGERASHGHYGN